MLNNQQGYRGDRSESRYNDEEYDNEYEQQQSEQSYNQQEGGSEQRSKKSNKINTWGNSSTMNITPYLYKKLLASPYFKSLFEYKTYHEVLDLIKNIKYIHPFTDGDTSAEPSIAFSLLFKLHTLKLSYKQLKGMLQKDMPTITKAMALLYVRFALQPEEMWDYFRDFVNDENNTVNIYSKRMSIGEFVRSLITNQKLFGSQCILPILPANLVRRMEDSEEFAQSYQKNKRKYYEKDYSDRRSSSSYQSDYSRKKQKSEPNNSQPSKNNTETTSSEKEDFEPAESRFSKPTFAKTTNSQSATYSKKYGAVTKVYTTNTSFSKKDITEVETVRLSKD